MAKYSPEFFAYMLQKPVAMDADGTWHWFEHEPKFVGDRWHIESTARSGVLPEGVLPTQDNWKTEVFFPGKDINLPDDPLLYRSALDSKIKTANRLDPFLQQGYQLIGDPVVCNGKIYRSLVKLAMPPARALDGYRFMLSDSIDKKLAAGWKRTGKVLCLEDLYVEIYHERK